MLGLLSRAGSVLPRRGLAQPAVSPKKSSSLSVELFDELKMRVHGAGRSVDKILVSYKDADEKSRQILVNRHVSTPLTCAKHISRSLTNNCALAVATYQSGGNETLSPTSRLTQPCDLEFIDFYPAKEDLALLVNQAFWRSAAVLTAAVTSQAVPSLPVLPLPSDVKNGFFAISIDGGWIPSADEVDELEKRAKEIISSSNAYFDTVTVSEDIAKEFGFETSVNLCKLEDFVCVTDGPTIASPSQISLFKLLSAVPLREAVHLAGVALPVGQKTSAYNWNVICENAAKKFVR